MTPEQVLEEFLLSGRADGLRPATLKWYTSVIGSFAHAHAGRELETISTKDLRQYIVTLRERSTRYPDAVQKPEQEGGLRPESVSGHIRALHRFFSWWANEAQRPNPMLGIKRPKPIKPQPKAINAQDFVSLFNATSDTPNGIRDRAILAFLADTGCRLAGCIGLTEKHLLIEQRRARVIEKGEKMRTVYFTRYTARLLEMWLLFRPKAATYVFTDTKQGTALTPSGLNEILKRLKKRANVQGRVNPHSFRHHFARAYIESGGDIATLAKLLGHQDVNVTANYYAVFDENEMADFHDKHSPIDDLLDGLT